ncbi:MAG TPA: transposase [Vicinamibacteria bacterium]|nr:transposase [Vicinamibacteria bacterium]
MDLPFDGTHIHAIVTRGVFEDDGTWQPIPYVDTREAELLFRHNLLRLLRDKDLVTVFADDTEGLHKLACYLMRSPVNLSRLRYHPDSELILYESKSRHDAINHDLLDRLESLARVLIHIPPSARKLFRVHALVRDQVSREAWQANRSFRRWGRRASREGAQVRRASWARTAWSYR